MISFSVSFFTLCVHLHPLVLLIPPQPPSPATQFLVPSLAACTLFLWVSKSSLDTLHLTGLEADRRMTMGEEEMMVSHRPPHLNHPWHRIYNPSWWLTENLSLERLSRVSGCSEAQQLSSSEMSERDRCGPLCGTLKDSMLYHCLEMAGAWTDQRKALVRTIHLHVSFPKPLLILRCLLHGPDYIS